ncbi:hypothetical protein OGAPHI_000479 [Ogataea philodendri]|uniref:Uncharacterized protein n=1 Tax=Ogataea philodendri TaxID=1378263 RepID=A0A9P8TAM9_9ASCO|nr:uncharacterized protein OGAPHI_000479 [Ogataea philodendri]KAH3671256.1 hypothetical protein OGAPHI_000479 [Ogataea philodendri]
MLDCSVLARILCALELVDDGSTWIDLSNSCTGTYRSPCSITNKSSSFFLTRISKYSSPIFNDMEPSSHSTMDEFDCLYSSSEAVLAYLHLIVFWISSFLNSSESCNSLLVLVLCESCTNSLSPDSNVAGANGSGSTNRYRGKLNPIAPPSGTCDRGCLGNETSSWVGWYSSSATSSSSSSSILVSSATSTPVASAASLSSPKRSSTASAGESPVFSNSSLLMNKIKGL